MSKTIIVTDACADIPDILLTPYAQFIGMDFTLDGTTHYYCPHDSASTLSIKTFYEALRTGKRGLTAQVTPDTYCTCFRALLEAGNSVICLCLSSALSGSYEGALKAQEMLLAELGSDTPLWIQDSRGATTGQGLLVVEAARRAQEGLPPAEIDAWLTVNKQSMNHWFTVDDLHHLYRGGRLSATSAFVGSVLAIKPVMTVHPTGHLIPVEKARGRRKSLIRIAELTEERMTGFDCPHIIIGHADCQEDASVLAGLLTGLSANVHVLSMSPIIASHAGPGCVVVSFLGKTRLEL